MTACVYDESTCVDKDGELVSRIKEIVF